MREANDNSVKCENCGYEFSANTGLKAEFQNSTPSYFCPACNSNLGATPAASQQPSLSGTDLEKQLNGLLGKARAAGLPSKVIVEVLRSELEFEAELGQGRRFLVQLIDLGFQETGSPPLPNKTYRDTNQNHGLL